MDTEKSNTRQIYDNLADDLRQKRRQLEEVGQTLRSASQPGEARAKELYDDLRMRLDQAGTRLQALANAGVDESGEAKMVLQSEMNDLQAIWKRDFQALRSQVSQTG
jgi:hypothetical protein